MGDNKTQCKQRSQYVTRANLFKKKQMELLELQDFQIKNSLEVKQQIRQC